MENDPPIQLENQTQSAGSSVSKSRVHWLLPLGGIGLIIIGLGISWTFWQSTRLTPSTPLSSPTPLTEADSAKPPPQPLSSPLAPSPRVIPRSKTLSGGKQMFQTFNNCGPASLTMALSYFGIDETQQSLGQALRPYQNPQGDNDDKSVSLSELAAKAQEYDLLAYHRPAGTIEQLEALVALDLPVITRTLLTADDDIGHYRVVKGYDQTQQILIQDDSYQGKDIAYTYQQFEQLWQPFNNEFLVLVTPAKQAQVEQALGNLLSESQTWNIALNQTQQQLEQNPQNAYASLNQSVAYYHLGQYENAVMAYETVADRLPHRALWYQLEPLLAYYQLEQYQQFHQLADQILNGGNRAYAELHYLNGLILQKQDQNGAAVEAFATATKYNSQPYWKTNLL